MDGLTYFVNTSFVVVNKTGYISVTQVSQNCPETTRGKNTRVGDEDGEGE